jgi:hypothetical protein
MRTITTIHGMLVARSEDEVGVSWERIVACKACCTRVIIVRREQAPPPPDWGSGYTCGRCRGDEPLVRRDT